MTYEERIRIQYIVETLKIIAFNIHEKPDHSLDCPPACHYEIMTVATNLEELAYPTTKAA